MSGHAVVASLAAQRNATLDPRNRVRLTLKRPTPEQANSVVRPMDGLDPLKA
jgi:hypothetical protein